MKALLNGTMVAMKGLLTKTTIALLAALLGLTVILLVVGWSAGRHNEIIAMTVVSWCGFLFVASLSILGGLYTSGKTGRIVLTIDLLSGLLLLSSVFGPTSDVPFTVIIYGCIYYVARCMLMTRMAVHALWKPPRRTVHGLRLSIAVLVLGAPGMLGVLGIPDVQRARERGRVARAASEIRNMDLCCTKLLADAGVSRLRNLFEDPTRFDRPTIAETVECQSDVILKLLRSGRDADIGLKPAMAKKLATGYMQIEDDPWGQPYRFYMGPLADKTARPLPSFRCFRGAGYVYDKSQRNEEETHGRGNPPADNLNGYPANRDLPLYIWSVGKNGVSDQHLDPDAEKTSYACNGGDDINNWDKQSGWDCEYGR